jgi:hypothetical protein
MSRYTPNLHPSRSSRRLCPALNAALQTLQTRIHTSPHPNLTTPHAIPLHTTVPPSSQKAPMEKQKNTIGSARCCTMQVMGSHKHISYIKLAHPRPPADENNKRPIGKLLATREFYDRVWKRGGWCRACWMYVHVGRMDVHARA